MKKSTTLLIGFTLAFIVLQQLLMIPYYTRVFDVYRFLKRNPLEILNLIQTIFAFIVDVVTIVLGVMVLGNSDTTQKEKAYVQFRYLFVIMGVFSIPVRTFYLYLSGWFLFQDVYGIEALFSWLAEIVLVVLLIKDKPETQVQKVNLKDYDFVTFTTGTHRFVHYVLDFLIMVPVLLRLIRLVNNIPYYNLYNLKGFSPFLYSLCLEIFLLFCYLLYYYLSEAIFRQTFGKMITNSCVVSDGVELSNGRIFQRTICRLIPFDRIAFLFGARWHDRASATAVVYVDTWEKAFDTNQPVLEAPRVV